MNKVTMHQIAMGLLASPALAAAMAIGAGATNANSDLYIDRPLCQYCPEETQEITEPELPAPGEWPQPEMVWEECAAHDDWGVQECFVAYENGHERYYWIKDGLIYHHYPVDGMPSGGEL